jgi:hypothetical protein
MVECSCCSALMPRDRQGHEIAVEWTVVRIETHGQMEIEISYAYLCPECKIELVRKQVPLFEERTTS